MITSLVVSDPPELWRDLGFVIHDGECWISGTTIQLGAPGELLGAGLHGRRP